jgi:diguanylate cyclase (GGDEF)-like protein/PAS domain S-box-containing protein
MNGTVLVFCVISLGFLLLLWIAVGRRFVSARASDAGPSDICAQDPFDCLPVPLFRMEVDGRLTRVNRALKLLLGISESASQLNLLDILHPEDSGAVETILRQLNAGYGQGAKCELRLRHSAGHLLWVEIDIAQQRDTNSETFYYLVAAIDIADSKRAELQLRSEDERLKAMVEQLPVAVWMLSQSRGLIFVNSAYEVLFGRSRESIYADSECLEQLIHPDDVERVVQVKVRSNIGGSYEVSYRILRDDGEIRYIREQGNGVYDEGGRQIYLICAATDISGEMIVRDELHDLNSRLREANLRLRESVRLDSLTGCLNRAALLDEADKALQLEQRYRRSSALVFFDLNNFKAVNDNFGHHVGDRCLIAFAEQIKARLRTTDELGRYGGDEFVALLRETDADQARKLLSTLTPIVIDDGRGSSIILRFSAGVACSGDTDICSVDDWLRVADVQMYRQKSSCAPFGAQ